MWYPFASMPYPYNNGYGSCHDCQRFVLCLGFPCKPFDQISCYPVSKLYRQCAWPHSMCWVQCESWKVKCMSTKKMGELSTSRAIYRSVFNHLPLQASRCLASSPSAFLSAVEFAAHREHWVSDSLRKSCWKSNCQPCWNAALTWSSFPSALLRCPDARWRHLENSVRFITMETGATMVCRDETYSREMRCALTFVEFWAIWLALCFLGSRLCARVRCACRETFLLHSCLGTSDRQRNAKDATDRQRTGCR